MSKAQGFEIPQGKALHLTKSMAMFDEPFRVIGVEPHRLTVRGVCTGDVLVINAGADMPIAEQDFPVGKLIALSDPSATLPN